jgi:hypothetical protein
MTNLRTLSLWAYVLTFGALWGYALNTTSGGSPPGMLLMWVVIAVAGSTLLGLKNHRIKADPFRLRAWVGDGAMIVAALVLVAVVPASLGLVRAVALLLLVTPYVYWYFRALAAVSV